MKRFQTIFMKLSKIVDYCYGKSPSNFGASPIQSDRMSAVMDLWWMHH